MAEKTLHDMFVDEIRDTYDAERQLLKALPRMAKAASSPELQEAMAAHLAETEGQVERLEQIFEMLEERPRGKHCEGMAGIVEEGKTIMEEELDEATMDACLIAAAQRAEHYEMAAYGTLAAWAKAMGHEEAAALLMETLEEEKAADEKLNRIAEGSVNPQAAEMAHGEGEDEEMEEAKQRAPKATRGGGSAARTAARKRPARTSTARARR
jgi:ferritin-like metal-binding protein YciE